MPIVSQKQKPSLQKQKRIFNEKASPNKLDLLRLLSYKKTIHNLEENLINFNSKEVEESFMKRNYIDAGIQVHHDMNFHRKKFLINGNLHPAGLLSLLRLATSQETLEARGKFSFITSTITKPKHFY